jgi:hypothetical protein
LKILKKFYWLLFSIAIFLIYLTTLAPSVVEIDSGELAAVQATLGIAHPTGYPLFTIAGYLFSLIPFGFSKIYQLNILAAIWCSLAAGIFVYTMKLTLDMVVLNKPKINPSRQGTKKNKRKKSGIKDNESSLTENARYFIAVLSGLILAFSRTYWFQSTSVEVYSLHLFLLSLIILFLLKAYFFDKAPQEKVFKRRWILFAFFLALGFTNHMTTILIIPGAAYLYFKKNKFNSSSFKTILLMLLFFIAVLAVFYSYLPIRASQNPMMNWGDPVNFENFFRHISGKQYQVWLFSSTEAAKKQLIYFLNSVPKEFSISLFICLLGVIVSYFMMRKIFVFLLITFITTVAYSINYDIVDIDSYFLLAFISLSFFSAFGIAGIFTFLRNERSRHLVPAILVVLFLGVQIYGNYTEVDQSDVYTFKDYAMNLINSTSKHSVIFGYQWDYYISESYYFRYAENFRKDVAVIDKELMRRSWYYHQLKTNYPSVLAGLKDDLNSFLISLKPFERSEEFNPNLIETNYRRLMTDLTAENLKRRSFYIAPELFENEMQRGEYTLPPGYNLVPDLFLFKVVKADYGYVPAADPDFKIRFPDVENKYISFIKNDVATMLARRALYEIQNDKVDRARIYIKKIKTDFPDYILPAGLNQIRIK